MCRVRPRRVRWKGYAARFDDLFRSLAQRRGFREYLAGLLAPRERNKTLTALAGAEPVSGAQHPAVQRLQFFLSESRWDPEQVNARRLELLLADPATAPHAGGVLVIDDSGDRKDGAKTAHVGHQWLGRYGKTDNGVVTVTTVWADERLYYPVHAVPYTPARHFPKGKNDPAFRTKLAIGADLAVRARDAGFAFRAVAVGQRLRGPGRVPRRAGRGRAAVRDGPQAPPGHLGLRPGRAHPGRCSPGAGLGRARRPRRLAPGDPDLPRRAHRDLAGRRRHAGLVGDQTAPGAWWWPPPTRPPCRPRPPGISSRTCPGPAARARLTARTRPPAWPRSRGSTASGTGSSRATSRSKTSWAGPTSRSAPTPRSAGTRPWSTAAFSFCWDAWFADTPPPHDPAPPRPAPGRGERGGHTAPYPRPRRPGHGRCARYAPGFPLDRAAALVASMVQGAPPPQLQALINSVAAGRGLHLYIPN